MALWNSKEQQSRKAGWQLLFAMILEWSGCVKCRATAIQSSPPVSAAESPMGWGRAAGQGGMLRADVPRPGIHPAVESAVIGASASHSCCPRLSTSQKLCGIVQSI